MGASRFVVFGGRYLQLQPAAAASFHAYAEKMSIGGNATRSSVFPGKSLPFHYNGEPWGFAAVPHGAAVAAFFRCGAMLASTKQ
jgi:hypothetical protein